MMEEWRDVPGYEGLYQVSDAGRVRRIDSIAGSVKPRPRKGRLLALVIARTGYPVVSMCRNNKRVQRLVHGLVALAFLGPRPSGLCINHKNGIKTDNRVENLEYCTPRENDRHSRDILGNNHSGERHGSAKLTECEVQEIRRLCAIGTVRQRDIAKMFKVNQGTISAINTGRLWAALPRGKNG